MKRRVLTAVAAFALAFAAILGLGATPAWAATSYTPIGGRTEFYKNLVVNSDANIPDITFNYTITRGTPVAATSSTREILASDVSATIGNAVFSNNDTSSAKAGLPTDDPSGTPTADKRYARRSVEVTFPSSSFTKPGVYRYVISETNGGKPGVTYDSNPRYLDVFVVADPSNALSVNSCILRAAATDIGLNGQYVDNSNAKSESYTNEITQYDFAFSKTIDGNQGDKNKRFTFTLGISNAIPGTYVVNNTNVTGNPSSITVEANGSYSGSFDMTDGSNFKIFGLNKDAICTVSEDNEDYTATHTVDTGSSVTGNTSGAITLASADSKVAFTNTRNGIIPTGIILTVAPFAIGLMLFGALTALFVSKSLRRSV